MENRDKVKATVEKDKKRDKEGKVGKFCVISNQCDGVFVTYE